ncbi:ParA family protein [Streptomyces sp. NPDC059916]|uniref:ParA family protein n=1 Tax=Streptomyces sp. NPDC059916 TaxID=3347001 RepID=UPI0036889FA2
MPHITTLLNQKGGIGKSTIAVNLAAVYSEILDGPDAEVPSVAVVSVDPQGTSIEWAGKVEKSGRKVPFHVLDMSDRLKDLKRLRQGKASIIIVDTPGFLPLKTGDGSLDPLGDGTVGDTLRAVLDITDDVMVPLETEGAGFTPTRTTIERVIKPRQIPYGVVLSNWDPRDNTLDLERTKNLATKAQWSLFKSTIRKYKLHGRGITEGRFCTQYENSHTATKAKQDFLALALEHQLVRHKRAAGEL